MPATCQRLPEQSIIVIAVTEPFDPLTDLASIGREYATLAAQIDGPIYLIIDMRHWNIKFTDLVNVMDIEARRAPGVPSRLHTVLVSSSQIAALGAKATGQTQYTGKETPLFASMDEALAYAAAELARK